MRVKNLNPPPLSPLPPGERRRKKEHGDRIMKRRDFLKFFLLGGIFSLFSKKVKAEKKPENKLKEAMFWKRLD